MSSNNNYNSAQLPIHTGGSRQSSRRPSGLNLQQYQQQPEDEEAGSPYSPTTFFSSTNTNGYFDGRPVLSANSPHLAASTPPCQMRPRIGGKTPSFYKLQDLFTSQEAIQHILNAIATSTGEDEMVNNPQPPQLNKQCISWCLKKAAQQEGDLATDDLITLLADWSSRPQVANTRFDLPKPFESILQVRRTRKRRMTINDGSSSGSSSSSSSGGGSSSRSSSSNKRTSSLHLISLARA